MKIDTLYANGCSWTAGNGIEHDSILQHLPLIERYNYLESYAWPKKLGDLLQISNVINQAEGAGSNARMMRTTIEFLLNYPKDKYKSLFVVLGWTTVDRNEIYLQEDDKKGWCKFNINQPVSSHYAPSFRPDFSKSFLYKIDNWQKEYIAEFQNDYMAFQTYFQQMYLMKNLLENLKIKYLFFNSLNSYYRLTNLDIKKEFSSYIKPLSSPNILCTRDCDESLNVMDKFCKKNNIPISPCVHPMVLGHQMWALHLYKEIKEIYE